MYSAIQKNKRNTTIIILAFILFFTAVSLVVDYYAKSWWPTVYILGFVFAFTMVQYFFAARMAMGLAGGREITKDDNPRLWRTVENLAISEGMPMPRVFIIEDDSLNAFATGRDPEHALVAATTGILKATEKFELEGVMAHELSHVKNYDIRVTMIVFGLVGAFAALAQFCFLFAMGVFGGGRRGRSGFFTVLFFPISIALLAVGVVAWFIGFVVGPFVTSGVSRQREYLADASGAMMTRHPEGLMSALHKLETSPPTVRRNRATAAMYFEYPYKRSFFNRALSTHPPTDKRINRLAEMSGRF